MLCNSFYKLKGIVQANIVFHPNVLLIDQSNFLNIYLTLRNHESLNYQKIKIKFIRKNKHSIELVFQLDRNCSESDDSLIEMSFV